MRVLRRSSEAEMVATFLRGELGSARFGARVRAAVAERLLLRPHLDDEEENAARRAALDRVRGYTARVGLFHGFPDDVRWERAALTPDEVLAIRYIEYDYWRELSGGSRRPRDAAERIRGGVTAFGVPNDGFLALAEAPAPESQPELIVVGDEAAECLVVLEGHVRLTAYALRPAALPPELEVLLGRSPTISAWACW